MGEIYLTSSTPLSPSLPVTNDSERVFHPSLSSRTGTSSSDVF